MCNIYSCVVQYSYELFGRGSLCEILQEQGDHGVFFLCCIGQILS